MEILNTSYIQVKNFFEVRLFTLGETEITLWTLMYLFALVTLLGIFAKLLKRWLVNRVLAKREVEIGVRQAIGTIFQYVFVFIGLLIILSTAGIDLTTLNVLAGAIGIGVGFGLQTVANNFMSGLIILFERPIKVGDRIQVGDTTGDVIRISARATTVMTNDRISVIVPNAEFISSRVINWSHSDRDIRFHIPVGVSYKSDPNKVRELLLEVAVEHPGVMQTPRPDVIFKEFGASALEFDLRVWTREYLTRPIDLRSELNYLIEKKFKLNGIEVPYAQRDIHIRSSAIDFVSKKGK